jgi:hypothetical protein
MRHNKHLHIAEQDPIADWLVKSMKAAQTGTIKLDMEGQPAVKIDIINYGKVKSFFNTASVYIEKYTIYKIFNDVRYLDLDSPIIRAFFLHLQAGC